MKNRHNKKRNTAFLYEALIREATKYIVEGNKTKEKIVLLILKEHFTKGVLADELSLYNQVTESNDLDAITAEKLLFKIREAYSKLDKVKIYEKQSEVIKKVNQKLSKEVYSNFVPNYKNLATLSQLFDSDEVGSIKKNVLLEQQVLKKLCSEPLQEQKKMVPITNLVYKTFVSKFNDTYGDSLLHEQKELLNRYIYSFADNGIDVKVYLNEELIRLHDVLKSSLKNEQIVSDEQMTDKTKDIIVMIESFKNQELDNEMIKKVLKIQNLAKEIESE